MNHYSNDTEIALDVGTVIVILGTFVGALPPIAAGLAGLWYCVLLYDRFWGRKHPE